MIVACPLSRYADIDCVRLLCDDDRQKTAEWILKICISFEKIQ